ncbi:unnamed protein product [Owenia fusiformis]|uniref:Uncharacterized protein n=1 Tax=Owenia fusiformis TaxID=6347 RepID=A0A8J1XYH8_OWEFU|nr:unnamed protein product [Owenia fusiformis]
MDEFRRTYIQLCKDYHIEPQDTVIDQLKGSQQSPRSGRGCLNLSATSLTVKTCAVIGKILATDRCFNEIRLCDCMIGEEGVKALAHGLITNTTCKKLDLKGNNIRGKAVESLGRMLKQNKTLLSVCLEWNGLGMLDNSFAIFCDGLGSNTTLNVLDLRNNQINHEGATELATALKRNPILRSLDVRWNNVGIVGGRALLKSLQQNKTIARLELAGNNIPTDIIRAIDTAIGHNADRQTLSNDYLERTQMLSSELGQLKRDKQMQVADLMDKLDNQDDVLRKTARSASHRVGQLQETLEERKVAFNALAAKLSMTESELAMAETKVTDLGAMLMKSRQENAELNTSLHQQVAHEKEERATLEGRLLKEISESHDRNISLEAKVEDFDRKCRQQQQQIYELKEQLTHQQADSTLNIAQIEERLQKEKQKHKEATRDFETIKQKEISRVRQETESIERSLKERIQRLETQRIEADEELSRMRQAAMQDRLQAEENLIQAKHRIKTEEEHKCRQYEDKLRATQVSKEDLSKHSDHQATLITDLQSKTTTQILEIENLKRKIDTLNQQVSGKDNEIQEVVGKVRLEVDQERKKVESERQQQEELKERVIKLRREITDLESRHEADIQDKEKETQILRDKLRQRDNELMHIREDEARRASMLQSAVMAYVSGSPVATPR